MEPKGYQNEPRDLQKRSLRNRVEKVRKKGRLRVYLWKPFLIKLDALPIPPNKTKTIATKHCILCQRGAKMDPKSMPKLIKKKAQIVTQQNDEQHETYFVEWKTHLSSL